MLAHALRHEAAAGNLANAQTPGYRAQRVVLTPFARLLAARLPDGAGLGALDYGVAAAASPLDPAAGPLRETGRGLDVALEGEGFLAVATPEGERYTRDGRLGVDADGWLVDVAGRRVLGEAGPIRLPAGREVAIDADGTVRAGEQVLGRLRRMRFARPDLLARGGDGLLVPTPASGGPQPDPETRVRQGWLEAANVDTARELVELMTAFRAVEAAQQVIRAQDETLALATRELARL